MNDHQFVSVLNAVSRDNRLRMPILDSPEAATSEFLSEWAGFLEDCVRKGAALSDTRWERVSIESNAPYSRFTLEKGDDPTRDSDFRVGLQLLLGLLRAEDKRPDKA